MNNRADFGDLVAIVCGDRVRVERDAASRFRLPNLPDTNGCQFGEVTQCEPGVVGRLCR